MDSDNPPMTCNGSPNENHNCWTMGFQVHEAWSSPIAYIRGGTLKWMVYNGNILLKWIIWGTPILGSLHMYKWQYSPRKKQKTTANLQGDAGGLTTNEYEGDRKPVAIGRRCSISEMKQMGKTWIWLTHGIRIHNVGICTHELIPRSCFRLTISIISCHAVLSLG
jgi:hypothetical protein